MEVKSDLPRSLTGIKSSLTSGTLVPEAHVS